MDGFRTDPSFKSGDGPREFLMHDDLVYHSDRFGELYVPGSDEKPFSTDFASIPAFVPRFVLDPMGGGWLDRNGRSRLPAVLHDYLCRIAATHAQRVRADKVFREAMRVEMVGRVARNVMYGAVRANTERMKIMGEWR